MSKLNIDTINALPAGSYRVRIRRKGHSLLVLVPETVLHDEVKFLHAVRTQTGYVFQAPSDRSWAQVIEEKLQASLRRADPIGYYQTHWKETVS
jgi:hypothetical protein